MYTRLVDALRVHRPALLAAWEEQQAAAKDRAAQAHKLAALFKVRVCGIWCGWLYGWTDGGHKQGLAVAIACKGYACIHQVHVCICLASAILQIAGSTAK